METNQRTKQLYRDISQILIEKNTGLKKYNFDGILYRISFLKH